MREVMESRREVSMLFVPHCVDTFPHVGRKIMRYEVVNLGPFHRTEFYLFILRPYHWNLLLLFVCI